MLASSQAVTASGLREVANRLGLVGLAVLPLVALCAIFAGAFPGFGLDYHHNFYLAGKDILHGLSPYHRGALDAAEATKRSGGILPVYATATYPAPALVAFLPLSLLPSQPATLLFVAMCALAPAIALRILGVRDWRCYGAVYGAFSVFSGLKLGAISPLLFLGVAVLWRWRDRRWVAAGALAALVAAKLYLWPLGVWLLLTGRIRTAGRAVALALAACIAGWSIVGWATLPGYPSLISKLSSLDQSEGQSVVALGMRLGLPSRAAFAVALLAGAALLGLAVRARRRRADAEVFVLCVAGCLVLSPVVWNHYLILLFIPLCLRRPAFDASWLVPWLLVFSVDQIGHAASAAYVAGNVLSLGVTAAVVVLSLRDTAEPWAVPGSNRGPLACKASALTS